VRYTIAVLGLSIACSAAAGQSEVLVSDFGGSKVVRFELATSLPIDHFVGFGISPLSDARGMAFDSAGDLYVASRGNSSIQRYDGQSGQPKGAFVNNNVGDLAAPEDLVFDDDGNLYVTSWNNSSVRRYDPDGDPDDEAFIFYQGNEPGFLNGPSGLAFGPDGNLYVVCRNSDEVKCYDGETGDYIETVLSPDNAVIDGPVGIVFDDDGNFYVSSEITDSIVKVDAQGDASTIVASGIGGLDSPWGITIGPDDKLYVAMRGGNGAVKRYTLDGTPMGDYLGANAGGLTGDYAFVIFKPDACLADANGDGILNILDFVTFQQLFQEGCGG